MINRLRQLKAKYFSRRRCCEITSTSGTSPMWVIGSNQEGIQTLSLVQKSNWLAQIFLHSFRKMTFFHHQLSLIFWVRLWVYSFYCSVKVQPPKNSSIEHLKVIYIIKNLCFYFYAGHQSLRVTFSKIRWENFGNPFKFLFCLGVYPLSISC